MDTSKIKKLCRKYNIEKYSINEDGSIDVKEDKFYIYLDYENKKATGNDINLSGNKLKRIPIKFNKVSYFSFNCSHNNLTTLENSPKHLSGYFNCSNNKLTTLKYAPTNMDGNFICENNDLRDFYGFPEFYYFSYVSFFNNPVYEILNLVSITCQVKLIKFLNEYMVIRNGRDIIESRLRDALSEITEFIPLIDYNLEFKNYRVV